MRAYRERNKIMMESNWKWTRQQRSEARLRTGWLASIRCRTTAWLVLVLSLSTGCSDNVPVLEDDSEAVKQLKKTGADIVRVPLLSGRRRPGGDPKKSMMGQTVDPTGIRLSGEVFKHLPAVENMTELKLLNGQVTDEMLELLLDCYSLANLELTGTNITDSGLKVLSKVKGLNSLSIGDSQVTAAGLVDVPDSLTVLQLTNLPITDNDLDKLKHLRRLTFINLAGTQVTPDGLAKFKQGRQSLLVMGIKQN